MRPLADLVRSRLLPAGLTAAGVALVTAGLITWTDPTSAGEIPSLPPVAVATPSPTVAPTPTPAPSSLAPTAEPTDTPAPTFPPDRVATRVSVPALRIDLPVIEPPGGPTAYPLCDVAMYLKAEALGQPGQGRATYLYAHAREGMFLPLLEQSNRNAGKAMLGMLVQVWTSDDQLFLYEITEVLPHQLTLDRALNADHEQLWLQTSEGPKGTIPKLQVVAELLSMGPAADPTDAHPKPKPVKCA